MNENVNKSAYKKTLVVLRHYPEVEIEQIEHVLDVFSDFIYADDELDIAYTWKEGYLIFDGDTYSIPPIRTGEDMCRRMLEYLEYSFCYENGIDFEEEMLPSRFWSKFILFAKKYMDQLPEYRYLLNPYRRNPEKEESSCVIYLDF